MIINTLAQIKAMKATILICCFILLSAVGICQPLDYIPYRKKNLFGYCDSNKVIIIAPQYTFAYPFENGIAIVKDTFLKWGMINKENKVIVPFVHDGFHYNPQLNIISFNQVEKTDTLYVESKSGSYYNTRKCSIIEHRKIIHYTLMEGRKFSERSHQCKALFVKLTPATTRHTKNYKATRNKPPLKTTSYYDRNDQWGKDSLIETLENINAYYYSSTYVVNKVPVKSVLVRKSDGSIKDIGPFTSLTGTSDPNTLLGYTNGMVTNAVYIDTLGKPKLTNKPQPNKYTETIGNQIYRIWDSSFWSSVILNHKLDTLQGELPLEIIYTSGDTIWGLSRGENDSLLLTVKRLNGLNFETLKHQQSSLYYNYYQNHQFVFTQDNKLYVLNHKLDKIPIPSIRKFPFKKLTKLNAFDNHVQISHDYMFMIGDNVHGLNKAVGVYRSDGTPVIAPKYNEIEVFGDTKGNAHFFIHGVAVCSKYKFKKKSSKSSYSYYLVTDKGIVLNKKPFDNLQNYQGFTTNTHTRLFIEQTRREGPKYYVDNRGVIYYDE